MELGINKENVCINKLVLEKREVIFVQEDMIVPDTKPDILNTVGTSGNVCIYKKEIMEDKIKIDGNISTYIMYVPDSVSDIIRGLNANLDFNEIINVQGIQVGMSLILTANIKNIECKVINGRKINVKVTIEFIIKVYSNENVDIINRINNMDIQTLTKRTQINSLIGSGNNRAYAKDTIALDNDSEFAEILKTNINIVDKEIKISYNKVLAKSEIEVSIMYLTEDNRIKKASNKIPVVGFIDIQNISEENICDTNYEIRNILIKPNSSEEHSIYIELEIEVLCLAYEKKEIELIDDMYCPQNDIELSKKEICAISEKDSKSKIYNVKENVNLKDIENCTIINVDINPIINKEEKVNSKICCVGEFSLNFILVNNETGTISDRNCLIPFDFDMNIDEIENLSVNTSIEIISSNFNIKTGNSVECDIDTKFNFDICKNVNLNIIDDVKVEQSRNLEDYSLIIYIVKKGDTLWNIAKQFKSTVEDIVRTNGIQNVDVINVGEKLYIPKYRRYTKSEVANF